MKTSEHIDANLSRSFQVVENEVEAAFLSLQVRSPLLSFSIPSPIY